MVKSTIYFSFIVFVFFISSCKKKKIVINTSPITEISATGAQSGGTISDDGGSEIMARGVCWSFSQNPILSSDNFTVNGSGIGTYVSVIEDLKPNSFYYLRSYATNNVGTSYGNQFSFKTSPLISTTIPIVFTYPFSKIDSNKRLIQLNGEVMSIGGASLTESGFVWGYKSGPSITDNKINTGNTLGVFLSSFMFELSNSYYIRTYAQNSFGVAYGKEYKFRVNRSKPVVTTLSMSKIDSTSAFCGGDVLSSGGLPITDRGLCWSKFPEPTIVDDKESAGSGLGPFSIQMKGLEPITTYYYRSYAVNDEGISYGKEFSFKTIESVLYIGMFYKGGIIFYLDNYKKGGLIISDNDVVAGGAPWGCAGVDVGKTFLDVGKGDSNSIIILSKCSGASAVKLCNDYVINSNGYVYDDWFLPSFNELALLYYNLKISDKETFSIGYYWSSNQKDASIAMRYGFYGGNSGESDKSSKQFIRAARKF